MDETRLPNNLIVFDGVCNFCNRAINFIIKHDASARFSFTTIQSATGQQLLRQHGLDPQDPSTLLLLHNEQALFMSSAALEIAKHLDGNFRFLNLFSIFPTRLRDLCYQLIARNRHKLMGRRAHCMVPSGEQQARFID